MCQAWDIMKERKRVGRECGAAEASHAVGWSTYGLFWVHRYHLELNGTTKAAYLELYNWDGWQKQMGTRCPKTEVVKWFQPDALSVWPAAVNGCKAAVRKYSWKELYAWLWLDLSSCAELLSEDGFLPQENNYIGEIRTLTVQRVSLCLCFRSWCLIVGRGIHALCLCVCVAA